MTETTTTGIPRIGDTAPNFKAVTTQGEIDFHSWVGDKWTILFSHPADFTPVCSTELSEFARREPEFTERNTKLIGLSIDSIHAHVAWVQNLKQIMGVNIKYPMIADHNGSVANMWGMLHPGESATVTVRAVFVIDPTLTIRAIVYYPLNVGRNIDEVVRLLDGLQTTDKHKVACPVNWKPGEKVIVPPPKSMADVAERESHTDYEKLDFYLMKKSI